MIANVIHTFGSRIAIALISFLLLSLNAHFLGAKGLGTIGLIILGITIVQLLTNLINGSIIYFSSRTKRGNLVLIAYLWSLLSVGVFVLINQFFSLFDEAYEWQIYLLAFLQSVVSIHLFILLGVENIKKHNLYSLGQSVITIISVLAFYILLEQTEVMAFVNALFIAYISIAFGSAVAISPYIMEVNYRTILRDFKKALRYGFYIQTANTFQLLNYRLSYFILDAYAGRAALGQYTASIQLSEALLIPGRSIATVQYARISAKQNDSYAQRITFLFMKLSFLITLLGTLLLLLLPSSFYQFILGDEFDQVKLLIICMALGLIALSAEIILSHYFSGTGRQQINSISAGIGLATTLAGCFLLIPEYGAIGAAVTTALSYGSMFFFLFVMMNLQKGVSSVQFIPNRKDFELLRKLMAKR
jgi:O-antigen/teichoic acid export membrane protein